LYEAPEYVSSTDLFTRLNVGKIPLTDAELIKALVLSRSQDLMDQIDRAQAMAAEWDVIERDPSAVAELGISDDGILAVAQATVGDRQVDMEDRIEVGAALVRAFISKGL
jgi:hypothetical protein